jgi:hypothetical protein
MVRLSSSFQVRVLAISAAAAMTIAALAGCTATSTPKPSATEASAVQKCTPDTAKIQWYGTTTAKKYSHGENFQPVLVQVYDYTKDAANPTEKSISVFPQSTITYPHAAPVTWTTTAQSAWRSTLNESASLSGQVRPGFGIPNKVADTESDPIVHKGVQLEVIEQPSLVVGFAIECSGQKSVYGEITGIDQSGILAIGVNCAKPAVPATSGPPYQRAQALAPKYCPAS